MRRFASIALLPCLFSLQCIVFPNYEFSIGKTIETSNTEPKVILIAYTQSVKIGEDDRKDIDESNRKNSEERLIRALKLHPKVKNVVTDPNEKYDIKLVVNLESYVSYYKSTLGMLFNALSFFTGTLLPFDVEQFSTFIFQFSNEKTKTQATITRMVYFHTWIGILTIPLMPFFGPGKKADEAFKNASHSALEEAFEKQPKIF
ncbi:MAG: hypothetical protein O9301_08185 [Leptospira sp.]|nr:hypothetical protein [Leptospira sp.]